MEKIRVEVFGIGDADAGPGCGCGDKSDTAVPEEGAACSLPLGNEDSGCCASSTTVGDVFRETAEMLGQSDLAGKIEIRFYDLIMDDFSAYAEVKAFIEKGHEIPMVAINNHFRFFGGIDPSLIYKGAKEALAAVTE